MKVLHTRAAAETILLVTTCHNMNLLAVVTRSQVVVYRSTTLTVVTQLPLTIRDSETMVSACWSPSGHHLLVALQSGELFLLDVESGDLVRRFVPRGDADQSDVLVEDINVRGVASAKFLGGTENEEDDEGGDKSSDPLCQPPVLHTSLRGAVVACTWTIVKSQRLSTSRHQEFCLPLRATVSSSILDELEREGGTSVLILLDQEGGLSFLPGGMREVCLVSTELPFSLNPTCASVDSFFVCKPPVTTGKVSNADNPMPRELECDGLPSESEGSGALTPYVAYLAVRNCSKNEAVQVLRFDISQIVAKVTCSEVTSVCCIAEYCRIGRECFLHSLQRWDNIICTIHNDMSLPKNATLLRDMLVEKLARPPESDVMEYLHAINLATLVKDAEVLMQNLNRLVLQISNVAYRCYDIALHISQTQCSDRKKQHRLLQVVGSFRHCCTNFMREMRHEAEREKELLQWVIYRASLLTNTAPPATDVLTLNEPLCARWHPMLLRTLHRIGRRESAVASLVDEKEGQNEAELAQIVKSCMIPRCNIPGCIIPLIYEHSSLLLIKQCDILPSENAPSTVESVSVRAVAVTQEEPFQPLLSLFSPEEREDQGCVFGQEQEWVAVETQPLQLTADNATFLWCGVVDEEGRCAVLWERRGPLPLPPAATAGSASDTHAEHALVLSLTDASGVLEFHNDGGDDMLSNEEGGAEACEQKTYAILEIKGISTRHLKASISRARGFGVFYAMERFVVVDFYGG